MSEEPKSLALWPTIRLWLILMVLVAALGGAIGRLRGAPFYFGGAIGLVSTGMVGLFVLADKVANRPR